MWNECNCVIVWGFFGIAFLWDWNENWPLQSCGPYWVFQICWHQYCYLNHLHITQSESEVAQSCLTLCDPMDCSLPGFSVHGIFQASVLEWLAISFSRGSSWPRDQTQVSHIAGRHFTLWATREAHHTGYGLMDISISITLFSDSYAAKAQLWYKKLSRKDKFLKLCPPQIILEYKGIK